MVRKFPCGLSTTCEDSLTKSASLGRFVARLADSGGTSAALSRVACARCVAAADRPRAAPPTPARCRRRSPPLATKPARSPPSCRQRRANWPRPKAAAAASARERKLSGLLAAGEERAAKLGGDGRRTQRTQLAVEKRRLRRARGALAQRLVAIYESGSPSTASSSSPPATSTSWPPAPTTCSGSRNPTAPSPRAVAQVRNAVRHELRARRRAEAPRRRLRRTPRRRPLRNRRGAREAEAAAATCSRVTAARAASLATLKVEDRQLGQRDRGRREAASRAEAEENGRPLARRPLLDPHLHRDVRVRRQLLRRQPLQRRRRRLPDPALDLGALRRPGRPTERPQGRTGPDRRRNLGRLRRAAPGSVAESVRSEIRTEDSAEDVAKAAGGIWPAWHDRRHP